MRRAICTSDDMTPIERVSARSQALRDLGIAGNPSKSQLRSAYRKLAFEKHPDQGSECDEDFSRISAAYHLLVAAAVDDRKPEPVRSANVSRPSVPATESVFADDVLASCRALFGEVENDASRHVATRLYRKGRSLTYFVPTAPVIGINQIALPTGDLVDTRNVLPAIVEVDFRRIAAGAFDVPAHVCANVFPGARSVQIRFAC